MTTNDAYAVLGLSQAATDEQIENAAQFLRAANNPGMISDPATKALAAETRVKVEAAYAHIRTIRGHESNMPKDQEQNPEPLLRDTSEDRIARKRAIAELLIAAENGVPGSVRVQTNSRRIPHALELLATLGLRKPFLASSQQFVIDSFLTHVAACELLLAECLLVGPRDHKDRRHVWNGYGAYKKWYTGTRRFDGSEPLLFAINCEFLIPVLADVLEENKTLEAEMRVDAEAKVKDLFSKNPPQKLENAEELPAEMKISMRLNKMVGSGECSCELCGGDCDGEPLTFALHDGGVICWGCAEQHAPELVAAFKDVIKRAYKAGLSDLKRQNLAGLRKALQDEARKEDGENPL